jgi:ribosome biogenesis GTPase A
MPSSIEEFLRQSRQQRISFLLVGRTGVGKSSTINSLLGQDIVPVGDFEPTTMSVDQHDTVVDGVPVRIFDTPGLCDDLEIKGNDVRYLSFAKIIGPPSWPGSSDHPERGGGEQNGRAGRLGRQCGMPVGGP